MLRAPLTSWGRPVRGVALLLAWTFAAGLAPRPAAAEPAPRLILKACRLPGVETEARCGVLPRPLDPARPQGPQIELHVAVLPALARHRAPDPVFFLAGGPGQSAIDSAPAIQALMGRVLNRRDVVLVDQRGTGASAPLRCDEDGPGSTLEQQADAARQQAVLRACRERLQQQPWGDLRQYTTPVAMADLEAVRQALGLGRINLVGGSYGTRAALEYLRQFPGQVRRVVLDGVAPPDMVLPQSFAVDTQAALDGLLDACTREPACQRAYPDLRARWRALAASLPRSVSVVHPLTGERQTLRLTRDRLSGLLRGPLYAPALAAALPQAMHEATQGRFEALWTLGTGALGQGRGLGLATGMHLSVVCAEDLPRLQPAGAGPAPDVGDDQERLYRTACEGWPRGTLPAGFYDIPRSPAPVLLLSGAADPVTPPRHAERVARALGPLAASVVVPATGHGVMNVPCIRDVVLRFLEQPDDAAALKQAVSEAACAAAVPRPPALLPLAPAASGGDR